LHYKHPNINQNEVLLCICNIHWLTVSLEHFSFSNFTRIYFPELRLSKCFARQNFSSRKFVHLTLFVLGCFFLVTGKIINLYYFEIFWQWIIIYLAHYVKIWSNYTYCLWNYAQLSNIRCENTILCSVK